MFRLPFAFIFTGIGGFALLQLLSFPALSGWIEQSLRSPGGWARAHLLLLGSGTMIAMGAVYQLMHVVLQRDIYSKKLGYVNYAAFMAGTAGLIAGFALVRIELILASACVALLGILLFVWNVAATLLQARSWNPVTVSTAAAVLSLASAGVTGLLMGLNFAFNMLGGFHERLLGAHIWLGAIGWFGLLITGFSYKMLPMFYLAHGFPTRLQWWTLSLWGAAVAVGAAGFLCNAMPLKEAAFAALLMAFACFNIHIVQIRKHRHKQTPGWGVLWAVWCSRAMLAGGLAAAVYVAAAPEQALSAKAVTVAGWYYLWGWVAMTILGYLSKIAPFLWWTYKYGPLVGKVRTPTMAEMMDERKVMLGMTGIGAALVIVVAGLGMEVNAAVRAGGILLSLFSLLYLFLVAKVFYSGRSE